MFSKKIFDNFIHFDTAFASRNLLKRKQKEETFKSVIKDDVLLDARNARDHQFLLV